MSEKLNKTLAIIGHPTRGKEVIQILEMLRGKNKWLYNGDKNTSIYFIQSSTRNICWAPIGAAYIPGNLFEVYTIDEFYTAFPYKVGNEVVFCSEGYHGAIKKISWNGFHKRIEYSFDEKYWYTAEELKLYKNNNNNIMEKINIAELLKDCPSGMELDCTVFENLTFEEIDEVNSRILCNIQGNNGKIGISFNKFGCYSELNQAKCVIFPKGKTTWEGFVPPCQFKDGDIIITEKGDIHLLRTKDSSYCAYRERWKGLPKFDQTITTNIKDDEFRFATEEEKQKLFDAIKDNGYRWNTKIKTLEKLIEPNFKDGDIIADGYFNTICIFKGEGRLKGTVDFYCGINDSDEFCIKNVRDQDEHFGEINEYNFATEEEKAKLFKAIKDNGYRWNPETKTLEKLIEPIFKVGDKISLKCEDIYWDIKTIEGDWYICTNGAKIHIGEQHHYELVPVEPKFKVGDKIKHKENTKWVCTITRVTDRYYVDGHPTCYTVLFDKQDEYELVPNKFDINTLKPFESKVLVRSSKESLWKPAIFGYYLESACYPYYVLGGTCWNQCIPYEENEHLLGTTNDCVDYYKIK